VNIGQEVLKALKDEITEVEYNRYIKHLTYDVKKSTAERAVFYAPNALVVNWIKNKYSDKLAHIFEVKTGSKVSILITLKNKVETKKTKKVAEIKQTSSLLNPSHSFDNFMVGGSNQFAYAAVKSVSENAGKVYNPLFIYGGVGLEKPILCRLPVMFFKMRAKSLSTQLLNNF